MHKGPFLADLGRFSANQTIDSIRPKADGGQKANGVASTLLGNPEVNLSAVKKGLIFNA